MFSHTTRDVLSEQESLTPERLLLLLAHYELKQVADQKIGPCPEALINSVCSMDFCIFIANKEGIEVGILQSIGKLFHLTEEHAMKILQASAYIPGYRGYVFVVEQFGDIINLEVALDFFLSISCWEGIALILSKHREALSPEQVKIYAERVIYGWLGGGRFGNRYDLVLHFMSQIAGDIDLDFSGVGDAVLRQELKNLYFRMGQKNKNMTHLHIGTRVAEIITQDEERDV